MTVQTSASPTRTWIYRVLVYGAFITATFTIAGSEACFILLIATALTDPALRSWIRTAQAPEPLPYGGQSPPPWVWAPFAALVGIALVAAIVNPDPLGTLNNMRFHYRIFIPFVLLLALPYAELRRVFTVFAVFVALWAVYGAIQYRFGVDWFRPEGQKVIRPYQFGEGVFHAVGEFTHHITYGGVMLLVSVFLLGLGTAAEAGTRAQRATWILGGLLGAVATVLSLARSAWLGLVLGILLLVLLRLPRRWSLALAALGILAMTGYATLVINSTWLEQEFLTDDSPALLQRLLRTSPTGNDVERVRMWQSGWLAVQDRPWLGAGMGNAGRVLPPYREVITQRYDFTYDLGPGEGLHNMYLQVAFDIGALGLAAYLSVWAAVFTWSGQTLLRLRSSRSREAFADAGLYRAMVQGIVAALAGSMAAGLFENNAYDKEVQGVILLLMGLTIYAGIRVRARKP